MITLDSDKGSLVLPKESLWLDEFEWNEVKGRNFFSLTGDMVVEKSFTSKGRPITLGGDNALIQRSDLLTLLEWANTIDITMTLTLHDDRSFNVGFRYWDKPVVKGSMPKKAYADPKPDYYYTLTLKLVAV